MGMPGTMAKKIWMSISSSPVETSSSVLVHHSISNLVFNFMDELSAALTVEGLHEQNIDDKEGDFGKALKNSAREMGAKGDARVTAQALQEIFKDPLEICVKDGDPSGVMCSYNHINSVPSCADNRLLSATVRGEWALPGYIVADCDSLEVMHHGHNWLNDEPEDAVAQTLEADLDLDCGIYYTNYAFPAVQNGRVRETEVDKALRNLYVVLMRLGFFDGSLDGYDSLGQEDVCPIDHIELAAKAASEGIVLLQNNHSLPWNYQKMNSAREMELDGWFNVMIVRFCSDFAAKFEECMIDAQGHCGSCWAFGVVESLSDRCCVHLTVSISLFVNDALACCGFRCGYGCDGGYPYRAWQYFVQNGVVNEESDPYCDDIDCGHPSCDPVYSTPKCAKRCIVKDMLWQESKHYCIEAYRFSSAPADLMVEGYVNGPVEVAFTVYEDFVHYKTGVYKHITGGEMGRPCNFPNGGHCKNLAPEYEKAASILSSHDPPIDLAKVDANEETNKELARLYDVKGFPSLKILRNGGKTIDDSKGPRDSDGISLSQETSGSCSN
ncbi:uncharacterized protein [Aristolochia californica]|uniref:uncharacterized protein n=1 Tax=Aristolochia californica TaxID=171875 RepID=UPI0035E0E76A